MPWISFLSIFIGHTHQPSLMSFAPFPTRLFKSQEDRSSWNDSPTGSMNEWKSWSIGSKITSTNNTSKHWLYMKNSTDSMKPVCAEWNWICITLQYRQYKRNLNEHYRKGTPSLSSENIEKTNGNLYLWCRGRDDDEEEDEYSWATTKDSRRQVLGAGSTCVLRYTQEQG